MRAAVRDGERPDEEWELIGCASLDEERRQDAGWGWKQTFGNYYGPGSLDEILLEEARDEEHMRLPDGRYR